MAKLWRNIIFVVIGLSVLGLGGYFYWQQTQANAAAQTATLRQAVVERGTIVSTVSASGYLATQSEVDLFFQTVAPLPVTQVKVVMGQAVKQGEVLAQLDTADLELAVLQAEQALTAAQLNLEALQAPPRPEDVAVAKANVRVASNQVYAASLGSSNEAIEAARLQLVLAQTALDQTHRTMNYLMEQNKWNEKVALESQEKQQIENARIAALRYDQAQDLPGYGKAAAALAAMEQAQAHLDKLLSGPSAEDVEIAKHQISQAEAALEIAQENLANAQIVAPFAGVVAAVNARVGELASAALPAIRLVDASHFYLEVLVDEVDVARLAPGQLVTITLDALPNVIVAGRVEKIAPTSTLNAGVVSYGVRLKLNETDAPLRGGMTAIAEIVVANAEDVVLVPNWAIRRDRDTGEVFVSILRAGQITDVVVELGLRNDTFSEVVSGLAAGETVAVDTTREQFRLVGGGG